MAFFSGKRGRKTHVRRGGQGICNQIRSLMGRRIRITNEIRTAISRAIEAAGSQSELSRLSGVPQKNLSNYISAANSLMNEATWMQLTPFLRDYLPPEKAERKKSQMTVCRVEGITTRAEIVSELVRRIAECGELDEHTRLTVIRLISRR